ncbi:hypothetical protein [Roseovarius amoyensis]|uniref:hypothetical protein n=1 Tax=Roseovarius amoyensis TaxID=2211448 RepID=UPI000DBE3D60|nr:hypothetical protein [Roseovarius amoyensis]
MIGTVLASVSDRVDGQTDALDRLVKTATEARQAAFAARSQTDPAKFGEMVGETIEGRIDDSLARMREFGVELGQQTYVTAQVLEKAKEDKWEILNQQRDREAKADRLKRLLPRFGLGAVVLALVLTVTLPRFSAINGDTCAVFGGQWLTASTARYACVHYQD